MPTPTRKKKRKRVTTGATVAVLYIPTKLVERMMRHGGQLTRNDKVIQALPPGTYALVIR